MNGVWIRSQDGERLGLYTEFAIGADEKGIFAYSPVTQDQCRLGWYESKNRALKVMDEVYHLLRNGSGAFEARGNFQVFTSAVYQMPEA